jgi:hypothetical protein
VTIFSKVMTGKPSKPLKNEKVARSDLRQIFKFSTVVYTRRRGRVGAGKRGGDHGAEGVARASGLRPTARHASASKGGLANPTITRAWEKTDKGHSAILVTNKRADIIKISCVHIVKHPDEIFSMRYILPRHHQIIAS